MRFYSLRCWVTQNDRGMCLMKFSDCMIRKSVRLREWSLNKRQTCTFNKHASSFSFTIIISSGLYLETRDVKNLHTKKNFLNFHFFSPRVKSEKQGVDEWDRTKQEFYELNQRDHAVLRSTGNQTECLRVAQKCWCLKAGVLHWGERKLCAVGVLNDKLCFHVLRKSRVWIFTQRPSLSGDPHLILTTKRRGEIWLIKRIAWR